MDETAEQKEPGEDQEILRLARSRYEVGTKAWRLTKKRYTDDTAFRDGDQWLESIKNQRAADDRPCLTFPRLHVYVDQVVGDARQNRPSIKVRPVDSRADVDRAQVYEGLIRQIEYTSNAGSAYDTALECAVGGGIGYLRVATRYATDDSFDQDLVIQRIPDPMSVTLDPDFEEADASDAKWAFVEHYLTKEEFREHFPNATIAEWEGDLEGDYMAGWYHPDKLRVAEYWCVKPYSRTIGLVQYPAVEGRPAPEPETLELTEAVVAELERVGATVLRKREATGRKVVSYIIAGAEVLAGPFEWAGKYIPIVPVLGREVYLNGERRVRSLIHHAKDAQRMYNFWRTSEAEAVGQVPKAPYMATPKQIEGHEDLYKDAAHKILPYLLYNPDPEAGSAMPQRQGFPAEPMGLFQQAREADEDIKSTIGLFAPSIGAPSNERSGKAILARQKEGDTGTFAFVDNLARAITHIGQILVDLIPKIYETERVVRIRGVDGADSAAHINRQLPDGTIANDLTVGKYDVVVDTGPSYATQRAETADHLIQFAQALPGAGEIAPDLIAKAMDFPDAGEMATRFRRVLIGKGVIEADPSRGDKPSPPNPQEQQAMQVRELELQAKIAKAQADVAMAEARKVEAEAKVAAAPAELEALIERALNNAVQNMTAGLPAGVTGQ